MEDFLQCIFCEPPLVRLALLLTSSLILALSCQLHVGVIATKITAYDYDAQVMIQPDLSLSVTSSDDQ